MFLIPRRALWGQGVGGDERKFGQIRSHEEAESVVGPWSHVRLLLGWLGLWHKKG